MGVPEIENNDNKAGWFPDRQQGKVYIPKNIPMLEDVTELTRYLLHQFYEGDYKPFFTYLYAQSIWMDEGTGYFGEDAIKDFLSKNPYNPLAILNEEIYEIPMGNGASLAIGNLWLGSEGQTHSVETQYTLAYRLVEGRTKLVYLHHSFQFMDPDPDPDSSGGILHMNAATIEFVHSLYLNRPTRASMRIPVRSVGQTILLQPLTVLYIHGSGKKSQVVCVDRTISCNTPLGEISTLCPPEFLQVHRNYIVNTRYVTAIKRCKLELISGSTIPIPANSYTEIKQTLLNRFSVRNNETKRPLNLVEVRN